MKRLHWIVLALVFIVVIALVSQTVTPHYQTEKNLRVGKINKMANYLNEKYGYNVSPSDCTYFRSEDYSYHDAFLYGTNYDIPDIAIFDYNGKNITVTDRNGFLGDDGQLEELNGLLSGYFSECIGLETAFVEVRTSHNGNISDFTLNTLLHHSFQEKLTQENLDDFVQLLWAVDDLELIFYFKPGESIDAQIEQITNALHPLSSHPNLASLRFYILADDEMNVYFSQPRVLWQPEDESSRESDEKYIWGHYHVVNDVEHHYPAWESSVYQDMPFNRFLAGGFCDLDRGYSGGFGNREVQMVNRFGVVDLSDAALAGHLEEMVSYGVFRGYTILFRAGDDAAISSMTIADGDKYRWDFCWGSGPVELYAFKNGQLLELKTAYECAYLSPEDMDGILQAHRDHYAQCHSQAYGDVFTE